VYKSVQVAYVDCDEADDLVDTLDVETVQTIVILHPTGSNKAPEKIEGIKAETLTEVVDRENAFYQEWYEQEKKKAFRDIEAHIGTYPFFIFIKGTKEEPKCKFTRRLVGMLAKPGYDYRTFNILGDQRIRQWLKVYSNWPTFPQLFINQ
jgi:glutaredoxin-related protein